MERKGVPWRCLEFSTCAAREYETPAIGATHMDITTLLVIVLLVLLLGGGWYGRGRWYGR